MKVLIVNTYDSQGGAALASHRLYKALKSENVDSMMIVQSKRRDDFNIIGEKNNFEKWINLIRPKLDALVADYFYKKKNSLFSPGILPSGELVRKINEISPDIVHLHWICGGLMRAKDLLKIKAPIVWNFHDMWPFTGGCHYDQWCNRYKDTCGNCKVLESKSQNDLSAQLLQKKLTIYKKLTNLTLIGSSHWISDCARSSAVFKHRNILTIPNCIDTALFRPIDKNLARDFFCIPTDKKVILFSAINILGDRRKGAKELFEALELVDIDDTIFVIAGSSVPKKSLNLKYPTYFIPPLSDESSLVLMYNIADVMVVPSLQENLANSIVESLSCGIPVVAFNLDGNPDMIEHQKNGYLAEVMNPKSLAKGISSILNNTSYDELKKNARETALTKFDSKIISKKYIDVYENIMRK